MSGPLPDSAPTSGLLRERVEGAELAGLRGRTSTIVCSREAAAAGLLPRPPHLQLQPATLPGAATARNDGSVLRSWVCLLVVGRTGQDRSRGGDAWIAAPAPSDGAAGPSGRRLRRRPAVDHARSRVGLAELGPTSAATRSNSAIATRPQLRPPTIRARRLRCPASSTLASLSSL